MTDIPLNTYIEWTDEDRKRGECPVPDGSDVTVWFSSKILVRSPQPQNLVWRGRRSTHIIGYLVHSMPREPLELWVIDDGHEVCLAAFISRADAKNWAKEHGGRVMKLVEVDDD